VVCREEMSWAASQPCESVGLVKSNDGNAELVICALAMVPPKPTSVSQSPRTNASAEFSAIARGLRVETMDLE